jgi:iron complex outermembrane recepter protein
MMTRSWLLATAATLAFAAPTALLAQTPPASASTTAAQPAEEAAEDADVIIVTGTRRSEQALRVPYNISAIGEGQLREQNLTDIKRLLDESVAISAPLNSARFTDSVTVRGLNVSPVAANNLEYFVRSTLSYYVDDTPLPNVGFRVKDIARVETLLGPQGTLYGAGSLGGVIRYITNRPKLGTYEGRLSTTVSQIRGGGLSHDTDLMLNIPLGETLAFRLSVGVLDDAGYTDRISNPPWFTGTRALETGQVLYKDDDWTESTGGRAQLLWAPTDSFEVRYAYSRQNTLAHGTSGASLQPLRVANAVTAGDLNLYFQAPGAEFRGSPSPAQSCGTACRFTDERTTPFAVNDQTIISRYPEFSDRTTDLHALEFKWDMGFATLYSSTSRYTDERVGQADYLSQGFAFYCDISFLDIGGCFNSSQPGNRSALITFNNSDEGTVHETRLVSNGDSRLSWIVGLFYSKTTGRKAFTEVIPDPDGSGPGRGLDAFSNAAFGGKVINSPGPDEGYFEEFASDYTEIALFGELTYQITDRWKATLGARIFNYEDESERTLIDYAGDFISETIRSTAEDTAVSYYKFNTSFDITPTLLTYFTASQGFRRGGANPFRNLNTTTRVINPEIATFGPDTTDNFELGIKGSLFDRMITIEAAVYQINWSDTQTYYSQSISGFPVNGTINGPDAVSRGYEISARYRPTDNWSFTYSVANADAEWDETKSYCTYTFGLANGGCPGPGTGRTGRIYEAGGALGGTGLRQNFGARYSRDLADGSRIFASLSGVIRDEVQSDRCDTDICTQFFYPGYTRYSLSMGWSNDDWEASVWVRNLTNERALVSNQAAGIMGNRAIFLQPMTLGLNLSYGW